MISALSDKIPIDQLCFICAQLLSLSYSFLYRHWFTRLSSYSNVEEEKKSRNLRLWAMTVPGLIFSYICFGSQIFHLVNLSTFTYLLLQLVGPQFVHLVVLVGSMGYLSYFHLARLLDPGLEQSLEITAPMMIVVQKVTVVAFSIHDGYTKRLDKKNDDHNSASYLSEPPSAIEYFSYIFNFQTIICGPLVFYDDFVEFVDNVKLRRHNLQQYPSARNSVLEKLFICTVCSILMVTIVPDYSVPFLKSTQFASYSLITKLFYLYLVTLFARLKYYFAWSISESICIGSGLGFNGMKTEGKDGNVGTANWNLASNIEIVSFENSLCQRDALSCWNKTTEKWLRHVAYDRLPVSWKLSLTYILSAVWHGFHPGYYLTFVSGAMFTMAARNVRRLVRYRFIPSNTANLKQVTKSVNTDDDTSTDDNSKKLLYHSATWLATRIGMAYLVFPFMVLEFPWSFTIYRELYFCGHLASAFAILVLPSFLEPEPKHVDKAESQKVDHHHLRTKSSKYYPDKLMSSNSSTDEMKILKLLQQSQPEFHNGPISSQ